MIECLDGEGDRVEFRKEGLKWTAAMKLSSEGRVQGVNLMQNESLTTDYVNAMMGPTSAERHTVLVALIGEVVQNAIDKVWHDLGTSVASSLKGGLFELPKDVRLELRTISDTCFGVLLVKKDKLLFGVFYAKETEDGGGGNVLSVQGGTDMLDASLVLSAVGSGTKGPEDAGTFGHGLSQLCGASALHSQWESQGESQVEYSFRGTFPQELLGPWESSRHKQAKLLMENGEPVFGFQMTPACACDEDLLTPSISSGPVSKKALLHFIARSLNHQVEVSFDGNLKCGDHVVAGKGFFVNSVNTFEWLLISTLFAAMRFYILHDRTPKLFGTRACHTCRMEQSERLLWLKPLFCDEEGEGVDPEAKFREIVGSAELTQIQEGLSQLNECPMCIVPKPTVEIFRDWSSRLLGMLHDARSCAVQKTAPSVHKVRKWVQRTHLALCSQYLVSLGVFGPDVEIGVESVTVCIGAVWGDHGAIYVNGQRLRNPLRPPLLPVLSVRPWPGQTKKLTGGEHRSGDASLHSTLFGHIRQNCCLVLWGTIGSVAVEAPQRTIDLTVVLKKVPEDHVLWQLFRRMGGDHRQHLAALRTRYPDLGRAELHEKARKVHCAQQMACINVFVQSAGGAHADLDDGCEEEGAFQMRVLGAACVARAVLETKLDDAPLQTKSAIFRPSLSVSYGQLRKWEQEYKVAISRFDGPTSGEYLVSGETKDVKSMRDEVGGELKTPPGVFVRWLLKSGAAGYVDAHGNFVPCRVDFAQSISDALREARTTVDPRENLQKIVAIHTHFKDEDELREWTRGTHLADDEDQREWNRGLTKLLPSSEFSCTAKDMREFCFCSIEQYSSANAELHQSLRRWQEKRGFRLSMNAPTLTEDFARPVDDLREFLAKYMCYDVWPDERPMDGEGPDECTIDLPRDVRKRRRREQEERAEKFSLVMAVLVAMLEYACGTENVEFRNVPLIISKTLWGVLVGYSPALKLGYSRALKLGRVFPFHPPPETGSTKLRVDPLMVCRNVFEEDLSLVFRDAINVLLNECVQWNHISLRLKDLFPRHDDGSFMHMWLEAAAKTLSKMDVSWNDMAACWKAVELHRDMMRTNVVQCLLDD